MENQEGRWFFWTNLLRLVHPTSYHCYMTAKQTNEAFEMYNAVLDDDTDHIMDNVIYKTDPYFTYMRRLNYIV